MTYIGVAPVRIVDRWEQFLGNVAYWLDHDTHGPDEACIRYLFEQREIQPFHDGNSRLLRLVVNVLAHESGVSSTGASRYAFGRGSDPPPCALTTFRPSLTRGPGAFNLW